MQLESSVTLFDDTKVETRFAELQVTADGITSEVSKKVGNDEIISRINQSAEAVTINANKVNIEGAAIFSSGRLSQSSLDGAYDASGSATGAVNDLKSDLSSGSGTTVINGGHITTGTIDASRATITNINASNIETGTLDAARIDAGSLSIGKLDSDAQTTISNAAKTASDYITAIGSGGISVHAASNPNSNYVQIDGTGMAVYNGGTNVASFGSSVRVGASSSNHINIDSDSFEVKDVDNYTQFSITPSSTATSRTTTRALGYHIASGKTLRTDIPSNITSFKARIQPSSGRLIEHSMALPGSATGATSTVTISGAKYTLTRQTSSIQLTVVTSAYCVYLGYSYVSPRRVANISAGGYDLCHTAGDVISQYTWTGAGYLTGSKTSLSATLPVNKPILAESVTVTNVEMITRQNGSYTHGSSAEEGATWTVESAAVTEAGIMLTATRSNTTNATNNDSIGIYLTCDIEFS